MQSIRNIDLDTDPLAQRYQKHEVVIVTFAKQAGVIISREGPNHYSEGDALITGSTGDSWSVTRDRFDTKYLPVGTIKSGENGSYRNIPTPVLAKQMHCDFQIQRTTGGDLITGQAGDWLMQYAPGDYGIVGNSKFTQVYRMFNE